MQRLELEVQIVRRSREGVVIPVASTRDRTTVEIVARQIKTELARQRFRDPVLRDVATEAREYVLRQFDAAVQP